MTREAADEAFEAPTNAGSRPHIVADAPPTPSMNSFLSINLGPMHTLVRVPAQFKAFRCFPVTDASAPLEHTEVEIDPGAGSRLSPLFPILYQQLYRVPETNPAIRRRKSTALTHAHLAARSSAGRAGLPTSACCALGSAAATPRRLPTRPTTNVTRVRPLTCDGSRWMRSVLRSDVRVELATSSNATVLAGERKLARAPNVRFCLVGL